MSLAGSKCLGTVPRFTGLVSLYCSALGSTEMKRLAAFLILLSFYILFLLNLSEGARAPPPHTGPVSAGSGMAGRPTGLTWGPTESSYGFHITRLVLICLRFLATTPL